MDVVFVGGGPAGLAGAIELARLVKKDKEAGGGLGDGRDRGAREGGGARRHIRSRAPSSTPAPLRELFPELKDSDFPLRAPVGAERVYLLTEGRALRIPTPPTMHNHGNYMASLCEIVRWLGEKAEALGVNMFTGFPADAPARRGAPRARRAHHARPASSATASPGRGFTPPTDITAKVTVLAEGTRGALTQAWLRWQEVGSANPQIYALGVKELWETKRPLDAVIHTLGWPLPRDAFGGSFCIRWSRTSSRSASWSASTTTTTTLDVHVLLQRMKLHPLFRPYLEGGEMVEWGAKTIPEGGYYALPRAPPRRRRAARRRRRRASWTSPRSRASTTRCSPACTPRARSSPRSRRGDTSAAGARAPTTAWSTTASIVHDLRARRNMRLAFRRRASTSAASRPALMTRHRRRVPGRPDRVRAGRRGAAAARRPPSPSRPTASSPSQARRGLQVGQRDARRHPVAPHRRRRDAARGRRALPAHVPGRRLRARGRPARWSTRPTASTARRPTCSARAGRRAKAAAGPHYRRM